MASDVFESYSVTLVASVMLGYAAFGYKGMIFPILVQAVGVIGSIISTALVGRGITNGNSAVAMRSINNGFWRSAVISTIGFMLFGMIYLRFDAAYIVERGIDWACIRSCTTSRCYALRGLEARPADRQVTEQVKELRELRKGPERNGEKAVKLEEKVDKYRSDALVAWRKLTDEQRKTVANLAFTEIDLTPDEFARLKANGVERTGDKRYEITPLELA